MSLIVSDYPDWYTEWLFEALRLQPGQETAPAIIAALNAFHDAWAGDGDGDGLRESFSYTKAQVRAYALFYMSMNLGKVWMMLTSSANLMPAALERRDNIELLDLGCGPGTMTWAWLLFLHAHHPELLQRVHRVRGVDRSADFLRLADRLGKGLAAREAFAHIDFQWQQGDWRDHLATSATVAMFGNTLMEQAELPAPAAFAAMPATLVTLLEPGTCEQFHRVLPIRGAFLQANWAVNFPCTSQATCPMGARNWCHFHINRFGLPLVQRLAAKAGRENPRHHFTGFIFSRTPTVPDDSWRVMSTLRRQSRSAIRWLCDGEHLVEAVINRRDKSDLNRSFLKAEAGQILRIRTTDEARVLRKEGRLTAKDATEIL